MKTFLLIDASALLYRFFHALPPLTTPSGNPIGAIYGLTVVLLKIFREQKPDFAAAALDRPEKTFREEQFREYKIQRPPAPDALIEQIKKLPEIFSLFNIRTFEQAGFEADDLIGTLAEHFAEENTLKIIILSGDLDVLQLVQGDKVIAQIIKTGVTNTDFYNETKVAERYGLGPDKLKDYKGLVGDASDNIPGVKGVGPKTASALLKTYGSLEAIYDNLGLIPGKVAVKLEGQRENALFSRQLATIRKDVPIEFPPLQELALAPLNSDQLKPYFEKMGFTSLIKRLENNG